MAEESGEDELLKDFLAVNIKTLKLVGNKFMDKSTFREK